MEIETANPVRSLFSAPIPGWPLWAGGLLHDVLMLSILAAIAAAVVYAMEMPNTFLFCLLLCMGGYCTASLLLAAAFMIAGLRCVVAGLCGRAEV